MADGRMLKKIISESRRVAQLKSDTHRLLYTWALSHLDVEGRMPADPELFKGKVCPRLKHLSCDDIQTALLDMAENELIILYESDGDKYLQFRKFHDHNKVRADKEGDSKIPDPYDESISTVLVPELSGSKAAKENRREEKRREVAESSQSIPDCPQAAIIELYHSVLPELPRVVDWTPARQSLLRTRWKTNKDRQNLEWWKSYFTHVAASDFLMGRTNGSNGRPPFQANLEWLIRPQNMAKVVEGNYHDRAGKTMEEEHGLPADIF